MPAIPWRFFQFPSQFSYVFSSLFLVFYKRVLSSLSPIEKRQTVSKEDNITLRKGRQINKEVLQGALYKIGRERKYAIPKASKREGLEDNKIYKCVFCHRRKYIKKIRIEPFRIKYMDKTVLDRYTSISDPFR